MEKIKVYRHHPVIKNIIIYLGMSFLFLAIQRSLQSNIPFVNVRFLNKLIQDDWGTSLVVIVTLIALYRHSRLSKTLYLLSIGIVSFKILEGLFLDFNKLILISLFVYVIISFLFYQLLSDIFDRAYYKPNYSKDDLHSKSQNPILVTLKYDQVEHIGHLSSWGEHGCFVRLDVPFQRIDKFYDCEIFLQGNVFKSHGEVVAWCLDKSGVGISFEYESSQTETGWAQLTLLLDDLGQVPEYIR